MNCLSKIIAPLLTISFFYPYYVQAMQGSADVIEIVPHESKRDNRDLERIVNYWELNGDPLETNWWTVLRFRLPPKNNVDVARHHNKTIGFISYWSSIIKSYADQGYSHIDLLAVDPFYLKMGCGRKLLRHVLHCLRFQGMLSTTIHIPTKNSIARLLYEHEQFKFMGNFASPGTILPVLKKDLTT